MVFIDTNIFVYAHDQSHLRKTRLARELILTETLKGEACISTQVIQEFCNVAQKKAKGLLKPGDIRRIIREELAPIMMHQPDAAFYIRVIDTHQKYALSFYDAAIVQAALDLNCHTLFSEDLQAGVRLGRLKVVNPLAS